MAGIDRFPDFTIHGRCVVQGEEAEEVRKKRGAVTLHVSILCPRGTIPADIDESMWDIMSPIFRSAEKEMNEDDPLKEYTLFISGLSLESISNMSDEEISDLAVERPGHPGQYGFLLRPEDFQSEEHAAKTLSAMLARLTKTGK